METDAVSLLRELDFSIEPGTSARSWLLRSPENSVFLTSIAPSEEHVTARTTRNFTTHHGSPARRLFVGRTATEGVIAQARSGQVDLLTERPLQLIINGAVFTPEVEHPSPVLRKAATGKRAWGRWAVERCLLLSEEPLHQSEIAAYAGVSQQMVSRVCQQLGSLIAIASDGVTTLKSMSLLER